MSICQTGDQGLHRLEYAYSSDGGNYWRCLNASCGEIIFEPEDCQNGG